MSCYLRHLGGVFREAGVAVTRANRKAVDAQIRALVNLPDVDCPVVWRAVKPMLGDPTARARLVEHLRTQMGS